MDDCPADCAGSQEADEDPLRLPQDLTPVTRLVLTRIYCNFEATVHDSVNVATEAFRKIMDDAFEKFSLNMNLFATSQKSEMKQFIETLLRDPEGQNDFEGMHRTSRPGANVKFKPQIHPQLEAEINVRQVFTNHLRELNHILENILCGREMANGVDAVGCEMQPHMRDKDLHGQINFDDSDIDFNETRYKSFSTPPIRVHRRRPRRLFL